MAVVSTVLPAWFMSEGIRRVGANRAAMAGSVGPVATIFLGYWMLDEAITAVQLIGVALVLAGVTLVSVRKT
jgi:drug/metabolite transporter (DMT)-like permease